MTRVGSTFTWALPGGDSVVFVVKAIRWGPFSLCVGHLGGRWSGT